jgi:hypothetical protein
MMKIKISAVLAHSLIITVFLFISFSLTARVTNNQSDYVDNGSGSKKDSPTVTLLYQDTLSLPSFTRFDLLVKMKTGYQISAISLGFYYPQDYLEIDSVSLANITQGVYSSDTNGLVIVAWSDINPISVPDEGTIMTLRMKTLDLSGLAGTIKLGLYELSEFADQSANVIQGVQLEVPEIQYKNPIDTTSDNNVTFGPNPFNDHATVRFYLKAESMVRISLWDVSGLEVFRTEETSYKEGMHYVELNALDVSIGTYLLKLEIGNSAGSETKLIKVMALR